MSQTRTTRLAVLAAGTTLLLVGCSSSSSGDNKPQPAQSSAAPSAATSPADAPGAYKAIAAVVTSSTNSAPVTAESDPNHLLGRPGQYTSKITFSDSRIKAADTDGLEPGDVALGGAIEAFATPADAQARATYIQTVTKGMPALTEYDYVHGSIVVRLSRYLTPGQAGEYKAATDKLP
ncbi:hypothetical protein ACFYP6_39000 [Streptomyces goshikiensis]|uniref:hypothetical protein n=1 Tax=Streptomyces goshikiensis TaxID=1942 RepID=UPI00369DACD4